MLMTCPAPLQPWLSLFLLLWGLFFMVRVTWFLSQKPVMPEARSVKRPGELSLGGVSTLVAWDAARMRQDRVQTGARTAGLAVSLKAEDRFLLD